MDPFNIFPMKVWEETLDQFQNPQEKLKLIKLNRSFQLLDLFQEKGTDWRFSAALGILLKHHYLGNPSNQQELNSTVLNCRLVSKEAKGVVDNFADDYWKRVYMTPPFATPSPLNCMEHVETCLSQAEQLRENGNNSSPFICGGLLHLYCGENHAGSAFPSLDNSARLISHPNIGTNLRGIKVKITLDLETLRGTCNFVRNFVESVPNVVNLSISFDSANDLEGALPEEPVVTLAELPNLKHLEFYDYVRHEGDRFLHNYFNISHYFAQLTCLEITISSWKMNYNGQVSFPNLQGLLLTNVSIFIQRRTILDIIENLNAPSLKSLFLETTHFDLFDFYQEYLSFDGFLRFGVLPEITGRRSGQRWNFLRNNKNHPDFPQIVQSQNVFNLSTQKECTSRNHQ